MFQKTTRRQQSGIARQQRRDKNALCMSLVYCTKKAKELYKMSRRLGIGSAKAEGNSCGMFGDGLLCEKVRGVTKDYERAIDWHRESVYKKIVWLYV